jgi:transcriptional regulator with XRE-family HTH domain
MLLQSLASRRRALGMSYASLAKRSGVSMATVVRILSGASPAAAYSNVEAIATALGMTLNAKPTISAKALLKQRADRKAATLVSLVQGTSGLEGQAVGKPALNRMKKKTRRELLAGSKRRLW